VPVIILDTEQAALIAVAVEMLEGALTARVERADPEQVISKALTLQSYKLATVRALLRAPEPPAFSQLDPTMLKKAHDLLWALHTEPPESSADEWWEQLRQVINAPGVPTTSPP
jgi:hypothetical protein